jgi:hypothetical protein
MERQMASRGVPVGALRLHPQCCLERTQEVQPLAAPWEKSRGHVLVTFSPVIRGKICL